MTCDQIMGIVTSTGQGLAGEDFSSAYTCTSKSFEQKMYIKLQETLKKNMIDLNVDLHSFYSNKDDYIDERTNGNKDQSKNQSLDYTPTKNVENQDNTQIQIQIIQEAQF